MRYRLGMAKLAMLIFRLCHDRFTIFSFGTKRCP